MISRDIRNLETVKALLLIIGYQKTTPADSANDMFTDMAFYDFFDLYFLFILAFFPPSVHEKRIVNVD